jgi:hypothetical protein
MNMKNVAWVRRAIAMILPIRNTSMPAVTQQRACRCRTGLMLVYDAPDRLLERLGLGQRASSPTCDLVLEA